MSRKFLIVFKNTEGNKSVNRKYYEKVENWIEPYFGLGKITHKKAYDTKFLLGEIVDNFLLYDVEFSYVKIEGKINIETLDVEIEIQDDGNGFDPFNVLNKCSNIFAAGERLNIMGPKTILRSSGERNKTKVKYNLKSIEGDI